MSSTCLTLACVAELSHKTQLGSFQTKTRLEGRAPLDQKGSTQRFPAAQEHSDPRTRHGLSQSGHPPSPNAYSVDVLSTNYLVLLLPLVLHYF